MSEPGTEVKTGIFVILGLLVLMTTIFVLGSDQGILKSYNSYKIRFYSTQGLAEGSVVSLSGIPVGNIREIRFDADSSLVAYLNIEKKFSNMITEESLADIRTQGALGDRYIYITPGPKSENILPVNSFIKAENRPDLLDVISGKANEFTSFTELAREFTRLLNSLNAEGKSALLVENISNASHNMGTLLSEPSVKESLSHLRNILRKIDRNEGTLGALVNDPSLYNRLVSLMGDEPRNKFLKPLIREAMKQNDAKK